MTLINSPKLFLAGLIITLSVSPLLSQNRIKTWVAETLTFSDLNTEISNIYIGIIDRTAGRWGANDDIPLTLGSSQDARLEWDTAQTTDSILFGLGSGNILSIMELADMTTDWGIASQSNPTLYIHSADSSATTDYISLTHNQTNAVISNGIGSINLVVEGATADSYETTLTFTDPTADQTVTIANATGTVMLTSVAANGVDLANSVTGAANALLFEGATANGYETSISVTDPTADRTVTLADAGGTVMLTSLAANGAELANAVTGGSSSIIWEGATANGYETTLTVTDPTADRTVTLPDGTGTVVLTGGTDLTVADGGTGTSSLTDGGVLLGSGTGAITATAVLGDGVILIGDASGDPATLDVGSSSGITVLGTVATGVWQGTDVGVAYGGTGASSLTDGGVLLGSGTGAVTATAVLADGEILIGDGSTDPVALDVGSSSSITVLGTVATGTWQATDVGVAHGGTGASSLTDGGVLLGSGTGAITPTAVLADGEILIGDASGDPAILDVGSSSSITILGTVATGTWQATDVGVAYGGTGASTLTDGGILLGSGTGAITALGAAANGQIPIGDGTTDPVLATLTGTADELTVTNGGGTITLSIPDASIFVTPRSTGAAEFNSTVLIGANGTTLDGHAHILSPSTSTVGLVVEMPSSASADMQDWQYSGSKVGSFFASGTTTRFAIASRDLGDDNAGPNLFIGYNNNSTNANAGYIILFDAGGGDNYIWVDNSAGPPGDLRISNGPPADSTSDTSGTIVGTQSSPRYIKNVLYTYSQEPDDRVYEKLQVVLDTEIMDWEYKSGKYGQMFTGLAVPDGEHPWYGLDPVTSENDLAPMGTAKALNQLNIPGYLILSIKALNKKIERLENEVSRLLTSHSVAGR